MNSLVPLTVAVPLLGAAVFAGVGQVVRGRFFNVCAIVVAAATTGLCLTLLLHSRTGDVVYWFAGWHVRNGVALGIAFSVGPTSAAIASFTGFLATGALIYSWSSYRGREVGSLFYTLMLLFMAGMIGFSLTGDLFNMFVFFELMSVCAYALTGFQVRQTSALEGALQFAITNSIGAFLILFGIALVYGRTGALNLAQIGVELARRPPDALVAVSLALIVAGFLVKAGAAPFHFWLSDAYAVAPTAVAALLTGVMSDLGYHGIARVYWAAFSGSTGQAEAIRNVLVALGVASALVGGAMALLQAELKRLIAFATVANGGVTLVGIGVLTPDGLGGSDVFVVAGGLVRAAAILLVGVCIHHLGSGDELELRGR
ncbi:MAG: complex I subunit 5 family protein, partial [Gaiellaceae bacterium]